MASKQINAEKVMELFKQHESKGIMDGIMCEICEPADAMEIARHGELSDGVQYLIDGGYTEFEIGFIVGVILDMLHSTTETPTIVPVMVHHGGSDDMTDSDRGILN